MVFSGGVSAGTIYANLRLNSTMEKDAKSANRAIGDITKKLTLMGVAGGVAVAALSIKFVKMAAEEEAVSRRTEALLKTQGVMWEDVSESLDKYLKQLELMTAYNDTDLQEAFNTLIVSGLTYTEALDSMNTVTSMAYSLNRDLNSMAMLVGKAYNGQTGELSRYGIVLDDTLDQSQKFAALQAHVNENFADASERTDSLEGQMDVLKNSMFNIAEAMGVELMPDLIENLEALNKWGEEGGWKATSDALKQIAGFMGNVAEGASIVKDAFEVISAGYQLTYGEKGTPEYEAAFMRARFGEGFPTPGITPGTSILGTTFGGPSTTVTQGTPAQITGGKIPSYAGRGREERAAYGGLTAAAYYGTGQATTETVPTLNNINNSIQEGNILLKDVVSAVQNISIKGNAPLKAGFAPRGVGSSIAQADNAGATIYVKGYRP